MRLPRFRFRFRFPASLQLSSPSLLASASPLAALPPLASAGTSIPTSPIPSHSRSYTRSALPQSTLASIPSLNALPAVRNRAASAQFATAAKEGSQPTHVQNTSIYFTIADKVGALEEILGHLAELEVSLTGIESRPGRSSGLYDFYVDFASKSDTQVARVVSALAQHVKEIRVVSSGEGANEAMPGNKQSPWFPRKKVDLDTFSDKVLSYGSQLDADHPGFKDPAYRARRAQITRLASEYRSDMPLPRIDYTPAEVATWGAVYKRLGALYPKYACREHQYIMPLLQANCGYGPDKIPQMGDISRFLKECTGFTLRPVMGLLSSRDFLNALAFRVFFSTQYIRHASNPFYTPEPDICHELLGHVPLFADPDFADFSQEVGLASLGASEEDVKKLASIYWFTEFGLCKQGNDIRAFGAGLLSSFGELEHSLLSDKPQRIRFDPEKAAAQEYPITEYQPVYFVADSFKIMKEQVRSYANRLSRPFSLRYNPYTDTVEILDEKERLIRYASNIRSDLARLAEAIQYV